MVFTESCLSRNLPFWLVRCLADSKHLFQGCEYSRWVSFSTVEHVCLYGWTIVQSDFGVSSDHLCDRCLCARRWPLAAWCDVTRSIMMDMWRHENASLCFSVTGTFGPWRHQWHVIRSLIMSDCHLSCVRISVLDRMDVLTVFVRRVSISAQLDWQRCLIYVIQYSTVLTVVGI